MNEIIGLTLIQQIRLISSNILMGGIAFIVVAIAVIITLIVNNNHWRKYIDCHLADITQRRLYEMGKQVKGLQKEALKKDEIIQQYYAALTGVSQHSHKISEIAQLPLTNEIVNKKREAS